MLTVAGDVPETTCTATDLDKLPAVALTVMVRRDESPAVDSVAIAAPEVFVVACVTATPPEDGTNETGTPAIKLFFESVTNAVIVAVWDPSDRIEVELVVTFNPDTDGVEPAPPVPPLVVVGVPTNPLPPQAAIMAAAATHVIIINLRIGFPLLDLGSAFSFPRFSRGSNLHAESSA